MEDNFSAAYRYMTCGNFEQVYGFICFRYGRLSCTYSFVCDSRSCIECHNGRRNEERRTARDSAGGVDEYRLDFYYIYYCLCVDECRIAYGIKSTEIIFGAFLIDKTNFLFYTKTVVLNHMF